MGNCLVMEKKVIKIMRNDGKLLEYRAPMEVHHILTQFSGHYSLFDSLSNTCHLHPQSKLLCGRLYYLLPKETTTINKHKKTMKVKKKVRFANPEVEEEEEEEEILTDSVDNNINNDKNKSVSVVRVKMVVSKQELVKLLQGGGSVHDMVYKSLAKQHLSVDDVNDDECEKGWRPLLDSIPESD